MGGGGGGGNGEFYIRDETHFISIIILQHIYRRIQINLHNNLWSRILARKKVENQKKMGGKGIKGVAGLAQTPKLDNRND